LSNPKYDVVADKRRHRNHKFQDNPESKHPTLMKLYVRHLHPGNGYERI